MKKLTFVSILCCFFLLLAGCGSGTEKNESSASQQPSSGQSAEAASAAGESAAQTQDEAGYPVDLAFGDWSDDPEQLLLNVRDTFAGGEPISFGVELPEKLGVKTVTVNLYKSANGQMLDSWDDTVDPDWESFAFEFHTPDSDGELEQGEYELAVFKDTTRIAEGTFSIE